MRILVTGGTGFIGSRFASLCHDHEIAILSRVGRGPAHGRYLWGSIDTPPWDEIEDFAPEVCLHAAWFETSSANFEASEHRQWTRWSLRFLKRLANLPLSQVIVLGTCLEYDLSQGTDLDEDTTPLRPRSRYAEAKHELHCRLRENWTSGLALCWARVFNAYGAKEPPGRFVTAMIRQLRSPDGVVLRSPNSVRDLIHCDDVARALLRVLECRFNGAINIGTATGVEVQVVACKLANLLNCPQRVRLAEGSEAQRGEYVVAANARLRSLGWSPSVNLDDGLKTMVASETGSL